MIIIIVVLVVLLLLLRVPLILVELLLVLVLLVLSWVKCLLLVGGAKRLELVLGFHISSIVLLRLRLIVPVILLLVFHLRLKILLLVLEPGSVPLHVEFLSPDTQFRDWNEFFCFCIQWLLWLWLFSNVVGLLFVFLFSPNFFLWLVLGFFLV